MKDYILSFRINDNILIRTDIKKIFAYTRNVLYANFEFVGSLWDEVSPRVAQFYRDSKTSYDVEIVDGVCQIPWEVLEGEGILKVTVFGGDLISTNAVEIRVWQSGIVGGLVPTAASPSVYSYIVETAKKIEEDYNSMKDSLESFDEAIDEGLKTIDEKVSEAEEMINQIIEEVSEIESISNDEIDEVTKILFKEGVNDE